MAVRDYTTRRNAIVTALVTALKAIDGTGNYVSNVQDNVIGKRVFWDAVDDFPSLYVSAGTETRDYAGGGGFKWRFLDITIMAYVRDEDNSLEELEKLLEDVETVLESNNTISYTDNAGATSNINEITILSVVTDEGLLAPNGVGEIICRIRY